MLLIMTRKRKPQYKQLAFETAIRNPERYKDILTFMYNYNGIQLNDSNLLEIVSNMYLEGLVTSDDFNFTYNDKKEDIYNAVIDINSTRRADGGYPAGYPSRFWTYMRTLSEFGFVYAQYNEIFLIGDVGLKLVKNIIDPQEAFSLQAMKYNRKSPYKNVLNDFNYFKFIINVLKRLKEKNKKLTYNQFIVSLFSKDGNVEEFLELIKNNDFSNSDITYEYLLENYPSVNKYQTVMEDYPDVALRILRITGFANVEYKGILLIDLNKEKEDYLDEIMKLNYTLTNIEKQNAKSYFIKIEKVSDYELSLIYQNRDKFKKIKNYNRILKNVINEYQIDEKAIIKNIKDLCSNKRIDDERFKYISDPLKLEFFMALFMYKIYGKNFEIKPNYKIDANGFPISHAPGNTGDIEIFNENIYWLLEVTLIRNKTQQLNNETINLFRHINAKENSEKYLSLVAPIIHSDTEKIYGAATILLLSEEMKNLFAKPYNILEFIEISQSKNNLEDMKKYTKTILDKAIKNLLAFQNNK